VVITSSPICRTDSSRWISEGLERAIRGNARIRIEGTRHLVAARVRLPEAPG
jgi:hypothetical protein